MPLSLFLLSLKQLTKAFLLSCGLISGLVAAPFEASTLHYPPYEYMEEGEAKGIVIDIISEAIRRSRAEGINYTFYPWRRAVNSIEFGDSDLLFNAGKNEARQEWGYYVDSPLVTQHYVLFKRRSTDLVINGNFDNVNNVPIAIRTGYLYGSGVFRDALDQGRFSYIVQSETTMQSIDLLLNNRVDIFVGDYLPVMHYIKENGLEDQIDIVKKSDTGEKNVVLEWPTYIIFSKKKVSKEYVDQIDMILDEMKLDGSYMQYFHKYQVENR